MTAGFFSPMPPARTGVADYSAALLPELAKFGRVEVAPASCDVALYHLGNNGLHADIYRRALAEPGVVVLHDAVLHHFFLGQLDEASYLEEFAYNYGEWSRGLAHELWQGRASSGTDSRYFEYPMLRRVAERARTVVVHNPEAARMAGQHAPRARIVEIPHLFSPPPLPGAAEAIRYRQGAGIPVDAFLFGVFGYLRESKRLVSVLEAFAQVHQVRPQAALLIAGQFVSSDLRRAVEPLLKQPGIYRLPYLAEREFWLAAAAVDVCVNLRYPAAGETSGIAIRLMGMGKPVLVTESPECARFPEDTCLRIPPGPAEEESLRAHMDLLVSIPGVAAEVGERAAKHIREHHRPEQVAAQYWAALCDAVQGRAA